MSIDIETGPAFDKRLAELVWECANDTVKTTVINTLALSIASDRKLADKLSTKVFAKLVQDSTSLIFESKPVTAVIEELETRITQTVNDTKDRVAEEIAKPLLQSIERMGQTVTEKAIAAATKQLSSELKSFIDKSSTTTIRALAMRSIFNGAVEAAKQRALDHQFSIDNEFRAAIIAALDAMKKPPPDGCE